MYLCVPIHALCFTVLIFTSKTIDDCIWYIRTFCTLISTWFVQFQYFQVKLHTRVYIGGCFRYDDYILAVCCTYHKETVVMV